MISVYSSLMGHKKGDLKEYIEELSLTDVFEKLIKKYNDSSDFSCALRYILYAYSVESEMLVIGQNWEKTKKKIYEKVCAKPIKDMYEELVHLKSTEVLETIQRWLDYNDSDVFTSLQTLKDLRAEMQMTCLTQIKKSSGEIDYTQKFLNAEYALKLKQMIKELESELIQTNPVMKDAIKEFRSEKNKSGLMGIETMLKEGK